PPGRRARPRAALTGGTCLGGYGRRLVGTRTPPRHGGRGQRGRAVPRGGRPTCVGAVRLGRGPSSLRALPRAGTSTHLGARDGAAGARLGRVVRTGTFPGRHRPAQ